MNPEFADGASPSELLWTYDCRMICSCWWVSQNCIKIGQLY